MNNDYENYDLNIQSEDPYYNIDPYEKNPYYDQAPYPKTVRRKGPGPYDTQRANTGYPNQVPFGAQGYPNQMINGSMVYPNGVSYEEHEARKKARASKNDADGSLMLGICSILACWTIMGGFVFGFVGIYLAFKSSRNSEHTMRSPAKLGLACSVIGLLITSFLVFPMFHL